MLKRSFFAGVALALCLGPLGGCSGGSSQQAATDALLLQDGSPNPEQLLKPGPLGDRSFGDPNAPVTIIEYASLTCPYCRKFHATTFPRLRKELIDTGKVRFIIREFPIGRTAAAAAVVTRCAPEKNYLTLLHKFLDQQSQWTSQEVRPDAIYKVAAQTGMSRETFDACVDNKEITEGLIWVKERARDFGVSGTPTFFIDGEKSRGDLTLDQIKAIIAAQTT